MERSIWKGALGFGLVSVPCKVYTATEEKSLRFNRIHQKCGARIQMPTFCPTCGVKVEAEELVKGYQVAKSQFITLTEPELASVPLKSLRTIDIMAFIDGSILDARAVEKSYFLAPDEAGLKAFSLLIAAMAKVNKVALAKVAFREREHLAVLSNYGNVLLLQTLFWADELKPAVAVEMALPVVSKKELDLAVMLVQKLVTANPDLSQYRDEYRDALMQIIQAKLNGEVIETKAAEKPAPAQDVVAALMASLGKAA